jgi:hypothetical protein
MHVLVVTFHLEGTTEEDYLGACNQLAPAISEAPGLRDGGGGSLGPPQPSRHAAQTFITSADEPKPCPSRGAA